MDIPFVFSNELKFKVARHLAFWGVMFLYQFGVDFVVTALVEGPRYSVVKDALELVIIYLPGQLTLVYVLLYLILPNYFLKPRYFSGILLLILFCAIAGLLNWFSNRFFFNEPMFFGASRSLGMHRILGVAGFASCIKFVKYWYERESRNTILERENLKAELQSLKAQIHPHFLFNTLNNIYSITQDISLEASDMILRLSTLLRYILYECNKPEIRLTQEFKIINDYISLEGIRYGKNMDIKVSLPENTDRFLVAPLLLLPLVENCFKHGCSKMLDHSWINIQADLKENVLNVKLMNSKPDQDAHGKTHHGIGLVNLRKRLDLIYPRKYELKILPEADLYVVVLKLELNTIPSRQLDEQVY
jgi:hypothetical protein